MTQGRATSVGGLHAEILENGDAKDARCKVQILWGADLKKFRQPLRYETVCVASRQKSIQPAVGGCWCPVVAE